MTVRFTRLLICLSLLTYLSSCSTRVVPVRNDDVHVSSGGVLYALPKTEICVEVTLACRDTSQAPYARFAGEMLSDLALPSPYRIAQIRLSTRLVADESHYYYVLPRRTSLQVDERHLLRAVGMEDCVDRDLWDERDMETLYGPDSAIHLSPGSSLYDRVDTVYRRGDNPGHPSSMIARKDTRSLRRQAMAAADRLSTLQEQRSQLIDGENADQWSPDRMRLQLQLIDEQIAAVTSLFLGSEVRSTVRFTICPSEARTEAEGQLQVLFFFSPTRGIVESETDDATPVYYAIRRDPGLKNASRFVRFHTGDATRIEQRNSIKYRSSGLADFSIESDLFQLRRTLPIAQYGPILELPSGRVKARFDAIGGQLIYLSR
mgnify:CR=1 FL=1